MKSVVETFWHVEHVAGGPITYSIASMGAFVGWLNDAHILLILSIIAVLIRIAIDTPKLIGVIRRCWKRRNKE